jgi:hypothetical protein
MLCITRSKYELFVPNPSIPTETMISITRLSITRCFPQTRLPHYRRYDCSCKTTISDFTFKQSLSSAWQQTGYRLHRQISASGRRRTFIPAVTSRLVVGTPDSLLGYGRVEARWRLSCFSKIFWLPKPTPSSGTTGTSLDGSRRGVGGWKAVPLP